MKTYIRSLLFAAAFGMIAVAQPAVTGALNTASYIVPGLPNAALAQGGMIAIFGRNLGPGAIVQANSFPLPTDLGGTSGKITVNGQASDLVMVYSVASQVGAIIPSNTPVGTGTITITFNGQTSSTFPVTVVASQFGIFTINQGGSGPAVVQNVNSESDRPVNTILNSAKPGQAMILWGTGLGPIAGSDRGTPPVGDLNQPIEVLVAGRRANVLYRGRSGCCAGIDQIVFEVPGGVQGCYIPLVVKNGNSVSNFTSIAVAPTGGTCSDPFGYTSNELNTANATGKLNVGSVSLTKLNLKISAAGISLDTSTELGSAAFYSYDASQLIASRGNGGTAVTAGACTLFTISGATGGPTDPIQPRTLDAGSAINVTGPNGAKQLTKGQGGLYSATLATVTGIGGGIPGLPGGIPGLPGGGGASASYLTAGSYSTNNGAGGVDVGGFTSNLTIPANFAWSNEASTTQVTRSNDLQVTWTGAGANDYVFVTGTSFDQTARVGAAFYCLERGSVGQLTVSSAILLGMPASSVVSGSQTGQLSVGVTGEPSRFTARGVDVGVFSYQNMTAKTVGYR
jgi:uncharacterized protein (TIGR03437 family)